MQDLHAQAKAAHGCVAGCWSEADALFGKRTDVQDANDRCVNSEVDNLLQRLQAHQGGIIVRCQVMPAGASRGLRGWAESCRVLPTLTAPIPGKLVRHKLIYSRSQRRQAG